MRLSARFGTWRSAAYLERRQAILQEALSLGDLPAGARQLMRLRRQMLWGRLDMAAVLISILVSLGVQLFPSVREMLTTAPSTPLVLATVREVAP